MTVNQQANLSFAVEAAEWLDRLEADRPDERAAFARWIVASPLHVDSFLKVTAVDRLLTNIDRHHHINVDQLLAGAKDVIPLSNARQNKTAVAGTRGRLRERRRWSGVAAAAAAVVALAGWWAVSLVADTQFTTAIGEQRTIELADGTTVGLDARTHVKVQYSDDARDIYLQGAAIFTVQPDPQRTFRVHSDHTVIQALGTQFSVDRRPWSTVVTVFDGLVEVLTANSSVRLAAGEEVRIDRNARIERRTATSTSSPFGRMETRLVFADDRLEDIAAAFNRWNRSQILIDNPTLSARLYSGAFDANDPESLITFLEREGDIEIDRQDDIVLVR